jgi:molybdopterin-containing oxidoreductase family iron-sulfur binding subunit
VRFSELIRERGGFRHMEHLGTEPSVYYLPPHQRQFPWERGYEGIPDSIKKRYDHLEVIKEKFPKGSNPS